MDYIKSMRSQIGHERLLLIGVGVIFDKDGMILLEQRSDNGLWGIPGGLLEIGEKLVDGAVREVYEETGLLCRNLKLFGLYSGDDMLVTYPNGDEAYTITIPFITNEWDGELKKSDESLKLDFFAKESLPVINPPHQRFINDWIEGKELPIID